MGRREIICDGTNAFVFNTEEDGKYLILSGWNRKLRNMSIGTKLLISTDNGKTGSPYKIISSDIPLQPKDQYFFTCKFNPSKILRNRL